MARLMHYCEVCGFEIERRGVTRHTRSVLHQKGRLIRAMLERTCITHAEIARRIGVTRERVRQLAQQMGFAAGRSRHAVCRMERQQREMGEFFLKAQERGFQVELLNARSGYINGKLCLQRRACSHDIGRVGEYKYTYVNIHRPAREFDICAWKLPDGRFLMLPKKLVGFKQTTFNPEESDRPGTASTAHYYREWIERWSLLGEPSLAE